MDRRKALAAALAVGMVAGPATTSVLTLGALASPAVAQGDHHGHAATHRRGSSRNDISTNSRTITLHGIITGTPSSTRLQIIRARHGRDSCLTTPKTETIMLDGSTTFSTQSKPSAGVGDLTSGDKVTLTLTVPDGTDPLSIAATSVADLGAPAPATCAVRGIAASGVNGTSFSVTLTGGARHGHHGHHGYSNGRRRRHGGGAAPTTSSPITVNFDGNTVFVDPGNPSATIGNLAAGDRLIIIWSAAPGTALANMPPAAKVIDLGPPPPIRYRAKGIAAGAPTSTTIPLSVNRLHPNAAPAFPLGTTLPVHYNGSTVFVDPGNPSATIASIAHGDRLIVVWSAAPGTPALSLPATSRVIDLGQ